LYGCTGQSHRGDPLPWHRKLPRRRPSPFFTHNQVEQYGDFHSPRECSDFRTALWIVSASARLADVPPQITDCVDVARTVCECGRVANMEGPVAGRATEASMALSTKLGSLWADKDNSTHLFNTGKHRHILSLLQSNLRRQAVWTRRHSL
jgi:hypothetical protein